MSNWKIINLGDAATFVNGYAFKPSDWSGQGNEIIRIQNLTKSSKEVNYFEGEIAEKYKVVRGDLLISWSATLGVYEWEGEDAWLNQHIFKVVFDKEEFDKNFFKYLISDSLERLGQEVHGATMKHITKKKFDAFKIPLPPLATQKKIAAILDTADAHRQKTKQLLTKYDELAQSIFLEMFGDPVTNPKGWEVKKMGELCGVGSSKRVFVSELLDSGIPFYRGTEVGALASGKDISPSLFISPDHFEELKNHTGVPKDGDLLMPSICPDGRIWKVNTDDPFYFKDGRVLWVKVNQDFFRSTYLLFLLKELFRANYHEIASGTTFAELKIVALKSLKVLVPSLDLQQEFESRMKFIDSQRNLLEKEIKDSANLFNSLLQKAFKGELV